MLCESFLAASTGSGAGMRSTTSAMSLALLTIALVACAPASERSALSDLSDSLGSQAAEGALLADEAASGDVTPIFRHEHALDLFDAASQVHATLLGTEVDSSLDPQLQALRTASERITNDLHALSGSGADAQALSGDLQAAADAVESIGEQLS
jgi:hypothetical protein